jgi:polyribonucleotide nucleotidyltransferase
VGRINGKFVINPTYTDMRDGDLRLMVVGTSEGIVMIEAGANEVDEETVVQAIEYGHGEIKKICAAISEMAAKCGKPKLQVTSPDQDKTYLNNLRAQIGERLAEALDTAKHPKQESADLVKAIKEELKAAVPKEEEEGQHKLRENFELLRERLFREAVIEQRRRPDGRAFDEIRPIWIEVGVLPRTHGSAIFTRGETQALVTTTLGTADDMQRMELFEGEAKKRFMLHYNFPPFSVGEVAFLRGAGRREIGHGALAERAVSAVLPAEEDWPYAMRVVSDILESNGSSSMATVCGASMSLMDAGVPIKAAVAGVAMGLVKEGEQYAVLTDIAGAEDHYGDMDFKVAGTRQGITALQMDIKVSGITAQIMREAMEQARRGRIYILDRMNEALTEPRTNVSEFAPRFYNLQIPVDKIRDLIGPGGKVIRGIIEQTGVKIDVEDSGRVNVSSSDSAAASKALQMIGDITATAEVGKTYLGKVSRLADFGAFVEILPGTDGLLHISEVAEHRIKDIRDELKEGDQVLVKVLSIEGNRIRLSRKAILKEQRAKMEGGQGQSALSIEGGEAVPAEGAPPEEEPEGEPNYNRVDASAHADSGGRGDRGPGDRGPDRGSGDRGPGGPARRRRGRGGPPRGPRGDNRGRH